MKNKKYKNRCNIRRITAIITAVLCIIVFAVAFGTSDIDLISNAMFGISKFNKTDDFVRIIDVGQGDSILIYSNGYSALIDTGTNISAPEVCTALEDCGINKLDVLLITHLDNDHVGGSEDVIEFFGTKNLILPEIKFESEGLYSARLAMSNVAKDGGNIYTAVQGMNFKIGEFEITVLATFGAMELENNRSIITMAEIDGKKFLFAGDMESGAEKYLLKENLNLCCDVLKVGHHGSSTSSKMDFLRAVKPRLAVISVGKDNFYGHPHSEVLSALEHIGADIYRTDVDGDVSFYIEGGKIIPKTEK